MSTLARLLAIVGNASRFNLTKYLSRLLKNRYLYEANVLRNQFLHAAMRIEGS